MKWYGFVVQLPEINIITTCQKKLKFKNGCMLAQIFVQETKPNNYFLLLYWIKQMTCVYGYNCLAYQNNFGCSNKMKSQSVLPRYTVSRIMHCFAFGAKDKEREAFKFVGMTKTLMTKYQYDDLNRGIQQPNIYKKSL